MSDDAHQTERNFAPHWSPFEAATPLSPERLVWPLWGIALRWKMGRSLQSFQPGPWSQPGSPLAWGPFATGFTMNPQDTKIQATTAYTWPAWDTPLPDADEEKEDNG